MIECFYSWAPFGEIVFVPECCLLFVFFPTLALSATSWHVQGAAGPCCWRASHVRNAECQPPTSKPSCPEGRHRDFYPAATFKCTLLAAQKELL